MPRPLFAITAIALTALGLAGCTQIPLEDPVRYGPFFQPRNVVGEAALGGLRRVVLLPVYAGTLASEETAAALDPIVAAALQRENRFEVVMLSRREALQRFQATAVDSAGALPPDFFPVLRREFAAEAVLFVDLTVHRAYRPLALGWRAKLAVLDGRRVIWAFDNVFSADDPTVANAARRHYLQADRGGIPADPTAAALQSPGRFAGYAAAAMFATLPPVVVPPEPAPKPWAPAR